MAELPHTVKRGLGGLAVHFKCPACGVDLHAPLQDAGQIDECPECSTRFRTPGNGALVEHVRATQAEKKARADAEERKRKPAMSAPSPAPSVPSPSLTPTAPTVAGVFEVEVVEGQSTRWIQTKAPTAEQARGQIEAMGVEARTVRLLEVVAVDSPKVEAARQMREAIPGIVVCPKCGGTEWSGDPYGCLFWLAVLFFFPLAILLLFLPTEYTCRRCNYRMSSAKRPVSAG